MAEREKLDQESFTDGGEIEFLDHEVLINSEKSVATPETSKLFKKSENQAAQDSYSN